MSVTTLKTSWLGYESDTGVLQFWDGFVYRPLIDSAGYVTPDDLADYVLTTTASATYLSITDAASTYATISSLSSYLTTSAAASTYVPLTRTISSGSGLTGGGDLSANRTLAVDLTSSLAITGSWSFRSGANFTIKDTTDATKLVQFDCSAITTGTTRTLTFPNISGTLITSNWSGSISFTGTSIAISGVTSSVTVSIAHGATSSGNTKTVNIGTSGASGSTTNIAIGSSVGGSTTSVSAYGKWTFNQPTILPSYAVSGLPSAASYPYGRAFVTDALTPAFGSAVVGGGSVKTPVWSDGSSWIVG